MGRDGQGNAWKYRQRRPHGLSGIPRNYTERKLKVEPQFPFKKVYITPFRLQRHYADDGTVSYSELTRNLEPTGIKIFDDFLQYLTAGNSDLQVFADRYGLRISDIDSMIFVLTGMRGIDFRNRYLMWMADQLLRWSDMSIAEVAKRSGLGSPNNLYLTYKREFNLAPGYRRKAIRKPGDVGKYKL